MTAQFARGPQPRLTSQPQNAPHAALLIDFDNVTMGIRSDLTKELRSLLNSDVIKGKVAVQRAYADWRRYPQYIVPLAENSVDLIFAPAYGTSKKNATDIRLAIDALELVFTRPEIGTFILLSGDSDFSSLVLKLKEYGKYVIGVGIRESSSDLLVQNCDEYYSYSGLTGLTRAGQEEPSEKFDPWELVEIAIRQMADQKDVMRSDRLKQILIELDPNFDEKALGFPKFNRFVQEAANRGLLHLKKMENGQFEVMPPDPGAPVPAALPEPEPRRGRGRREPAAAQPAAVAAPEVVAPKALPPTPGPTPTPAPLSAPTPAPAFVSGPGTDREPQPVAASAELRDAYDLLQRATSDLTRGRGAPVRDSDVKRRMLELRPGFDEGTFGFSKFSRFLRQAHDAEVINLNKVENGSYEVTLGAGAPRIEAAAPQRAEREGAGEPERERDRGRRRGRDRHRNGREREREPRAEGAAPSAAAAPAENQAEPEAVAPAKAAAAEAAPAKPARPEPTRAEPAKPQPVAAAGAPKPAVSLGFRRGSRGGAAPPAPPPILAGQSVGPAALKATKPAEEVPAAAAAPSEPATPAKTARRRSGARERVETVAGDGRGDGKGTGIDSMNLPKDAAQVVERLAGYRGVGKKSAEAAVQAFGNEVFKVLHDEPERVRQTMGAGRADRLLKGWQLDYEGTSGGRKQSARKRASTEAEAVSESDTQPAARKQRRGGSKRGGRKKVARAAK